MKTRRMLEIEAEFGDDIETIIQDFREIGGGNTWRTVAGILGIDEVTLWHWRKRLGLPVTHVGGGGHTDPLSYPHGFQTTSLEHRALELGFISAADLVLQLRISQRLSRQEAADHLGIHPNTITRHTPQHMRGQCCRWRPTT